MFADIVLLPLTPGARRWVVESAWNAERHRTVTPVCGSRLEILRGLATLLATAASRQPEETQMNKLTIAAALAMTGLVACTD
ncbi:MAG: hypothetical protein VX000_13450, partial [Myxococcota bacterium]|nr:hypothetical protein [Myxococcota bacterium]